MDSVNLQTVWKVFIPYAWLLGAIVVSLILGVLLHLLIWKAVSRFAVKTKTTLDDIVNRRWRKPTRSFLIILILYLLLPFVHPYFSDTTYATIMNVALALLTVSIIYALIKLVYVVEEFILSQYHVEVKDNLLARQMQTRIKIISRLTITLILLIGIGVMLLSFEKFRQLGTGLLASAGIASVVLGFAVQKTLGNLLAGIQIAITQPIRLDDVVIVENEWGRIEEITLTYVVVRIWDLRRLVLPISYFIEKPFQNWTRVSADILGTVYLYADYTIPVDEVRQELTRLLKQSDKWDGKVNGLQVTNLTERTMELRALMSAADASLAWDLRCEIREGLLKFVKNNYPDSLPQTRVVLNSETSENLSEQAGKR